MILDKEKINSVAVYARVSTEEQATGGYSLDAQLDKLKAVCIAKDWKISGEYIDGGFSGRNTRRPKYKQMFEEIDQWDGILILKMDRIHRNVKNALNMFELLEKKGKHFISFSENIDTSTAMGRAMMTITLVFAQLESEQIGERVSIGLLQKVKEKQTFMGHKTAFGYIWNPKKQIFIPNKTELDLVKEVYQMYLDGYSMRQISRKTGKANTTIKYFLHNCFYAGFERWCNHFRKIPDLEPIINIKTFNQIQQLLRDRCHSHRNYQPMLIKDDVSFKIDPKQVNLIPVINRAKHNYNY